MHSFIYYSSFISLPFLGLLIFYSYKNRKKIIKNKIITLLILLLFFVTIIFIYARFIERNLIFINKHTIKIGFNAKIVVISDLHLGVYWKNKYFLKRIVKKINSIKNIDAVVIPGDFTYDPRKSLDKLFDPLKEIKVPIFAVLWNHDNDWLPIQNELQKIREKRKELQKALEKNDVIFLQNTSSIIKNKNIKILWLWDNWAWEDDVSKIDNFSEDDNLIVITHNPDTTMKYNSSIPDLTIAGHTHGGQIRLPFLYKKAIPCIYDFDKWLHRLVPWIASFTSIKNKKNVLYTKHHYWLVFVSSWVGEVGLPMRLGIPPVIDVLELK